MQAKMRRVLNKIIDIVDDILAYILTIVGIMVSNYIPMLQGTDAIDIKIDPWRIALSAIVALIIIGKQEAILEQEEEGKTKARMGRRRRFFIRMVNALSQGMMWSQLMQIVGGK